MKKQIKLSISVAMIFSLTFFIWGCEEDFYLEDQVEQQLVILSSFTPDNVVEVMVTTSVPIGDTSNTIEAFPTNVELQLLEDGNPVGSFEFFDEYSYIDPNYPSDFAPVYISDFYPKQNAVYSISASLDGYPTATASNAIPAPVTIETASLISLDSFYVPDDNSNTETLFYQMKAKINIPENARSAKYFHLKAYRNHEDYTGYIFYQEEIFLTLINVSQEISILHESGNMFEGQAFTDHPDGIEVEFTFPEFDSYGTRQPILFELRHVSEDYFLFHKSIGQQEGTSAREGLLTNQAVSIHNNIVDGIGNFGGYNVGIGVIAW